jgi:hypothetical protein
MSSLLSGLVAGLGIAIPGGANAVPSQGAVTAVDNRRVVLGGSALPTTRAGSSVRARRPVLGGALGQCGPSPHLPYSPGVSNWRIRRLQGFSRTVLVAASAEALW